MRKVSLSLDDVKASINALKGENIKLSINRGRKKIEKFSAIINDIYPSVFTVTIDAPKVNNPQTFSYCDVLCGDVKIISK